MTKDRLFELIDLKVEGLRNKAIIKDAVEDLLSASNNGKPIVMRRLSNHELLEDFVQSMQCNMINCGELSIKQGVQQYIESISKEMLPDGA